MAISCHVTRANAFGGNGLRERGLGAGRARRVGNGCRPGAEAETGHMASQGQVRRARGRNAPESSEEPETRHPMARA
jgi:hypothetical protein